MRDIFGALIIADLVIGACLYGAIKIWKGGVQKARKVEEYEFNNITDGGVVKFSDISAARRHKKDRNSSEPLTQFGCVATLMLAPLFVIVTGCTILVLIGV